MFCCLSDWGSSESTGGNNFPGQRRCVADGVKTLPDPSPNHKKQSEIVSVVAPQGSTGGDVITVQSPTSGRLMQVVIPDGLRPNNTFTVAFPPQQLQNTHFRDVGFQHDNGLQQNTRFKNSNGSQQQSIITVPVIAPPPETDAIVPIPTKVNESSNIESNKTISSVLVESHQNVENNKQNKPTILVQVPLGTTPGSTIHVQVPGEDKILAAKVPPGVDEFHVAYEPFQPTTSKIKPDPVIPAIPCEPPLPPPIVDAFVSTSITHSSAAFSPNNNQKQSLMLVRVPPGVSPGTTIQVQVPGEDRMISAQVPPGVSEFYVAYEPRQISTDPMDYNQNFSYRSGMDDKRKFNNNQLGYKNGTGQGRQNLNSVNRRNNNLTHNNDNKMYNDHSRGSNQRYDNQRRDYSYQDYNNNDTSSGMAYVAPVLAGAALIGGAGYLIHRHDQNNNENNDYAADYDDNRGDGIDYGNDFDGGGYDDDGGISDDGGGGDY